MADLNLGGHLASDNEGQQKWLKPQSYPASPLSPPMSPVRSMASPRIGHSVLEGENETPSIWIDSESENGAENWSVAKPQSTPSFGGVLSPPPSPEPTEPVEAPILQPAPSKTPIRNAATAKSKVQAKPATPKPTPSSSRTKPARSARTTKPVRSSLTKAPTPKFTPTPTRRTSRTQPGSIRQQPSRRPATPVSSETTDLCQAPKTPSESSSKPPTNTCNVKSNPAPPVMPPTNSAPRSKKPIMKTDTKSPRPKPGSVSRPETPSRAPKSTSTPASPSPARRQIGHQRSRSEALNPSPRASSPAPGPRLAPSTTFSPTASPTVSRGPTRASTPTRERTKTSMLRTSGLPPRPPGRTPTTKSTLGVIGSRKPRSQSFRDARPAKTPLNSRTPSSSVPPTQRTPLCPRAHTPQPQTSLNPPPSSLAKQTSRPESEDKVEGEVIEPTPEAEAEEPEQVTIATQTVVTAPPPVVAMVPVTPLVPEFKPVVMSAMGLGLRSSTPAPFPAFQLICKL